MKKEHILIIIAVLVVATAALWIFRPENVAQEPVENLTPEEVVTRQGVTACLPPKDTSGPQTMECALGLKVGDMYYGLKNVKNEDWELYQTGSSVEVEGSLALPAENEKYDIVGIISVMRINSLGQATGEESEMQGYTNTEYGFSLEYSADFLKKNEDENARMPWSYGSAKPGRRLVTLSLPKAFMPQTNFSDAEVTVGVSADAAEVAGCLVGDVETPAREDINGTTFTKLNFSDAGAGNLYETVSYRSLRDNVCLALEMTIHSTNLDNYGSEQGITQFDKSRVESALMEVIRSFSFQ